MGKYNGKLLSNAHTLRKNMTKEERHLWYDFLKSYPCHVYKQRIIGNYIVDFYCPSAKLIIELDGSQHYEDEGREKDNIRSNYLESLGLKIIRIPNRLLRSILPKMAEKRHTHRPMTAECWWSRA